MRNKYGPSRKSELLKRNCLGNRKLLKQFSNNLVNKQRDIFQCDFLGRNDSLQTLSVELTGGGVACGIHFHVFFAFKPSKRGVIAWNCEWGVQGGRNSSQKLSFSDGLAGVLSTGRIPLFLLKKEPGPTTISTLTIFRRRHTTAHYHSWSNILTRKGMGNSTSNPPCRHQDQP